MTLERVARHEDVGRLQVTVHDQVGVRELDRFAHLDQQLHARCGCELAVVAPVVDALALHVLEHEVAGAVGREAGVEQLRDVWVGESRQQLAFTCEPGLHEGGYRRAELAASQQLHGRPALVQAVSPHGGPDLAGAATAEQFAQFPRAEPCAGTGVEDGAGFGGGGRVAVGVAHVSGKRKAGPILCSLKAHRQ